MLKKGSFTVTKLTNIVLLFIPFIICWYGYYEERTKTVGSKQVSAIVFFFFFVIVYFYCHRLDCFRVSIMRIQEIIFNQIIVIGITDVVMYLMIWMLSIHMPNLMPGVKCFVEQCCVIPIWSIIMNKVYFATHEPLDSIVIYDVRQGMDELIHDYGLEKRFVVKEKYAVEEVIDHWKLLDGVKAVFLCGVHSHERNIILKFCMFNGIKLYGIPRVGDVMMRGAEKIHMLHLPILKCQRFNPSFEYRFAKRAMDILLSGIAFVITLPIFVITSIAVKSDGGPAFYKQKRMTKNGKVFEIIKFRSMCVDAEKYSGAVLSTGEKDPRITKVGRIIRACRIDELPQLLNVLKGDMSIVGPRPERPEIAAKIEEKMPEFALRLQVKAGLTGYAQVYGKYNTTFYDKLLMDMMYIAEPSLLEDLSIMIATVRILLSKESTEGVGKESPMILYKERNKTI